jgi:hypothetical protein
MAQLDRQPDDRDVIAGVLVAVGLLPLLAPGSIVYFRYPWNTPYEVWQPLSWGAMLIFFVAVAAKDRTLTRHSYEGAAHCGQTEQ